MMNIYWPVYKALERELDELCFSIHVDDNQMAVYSSKITDLILRAAAEIESVSKELYKLNGGTENGQYLFDDVAIKYLNGIWKLDQKKIIISSPNTFQSQRILSPFAKTEARTGSKTGKKTYGWNNAYQNLKHDRANSMSFGSLKHLFEIMSALFLLNIYYKNETFDLGKDSSGLTFQAHLGSGVFSVQLAASLSHGPNGEYIKSPDFDGCVYYLNWTKESGAKFQELINKWRMRTAELLAAHPKILEFISVNNVSEYKGDWAWNALGKDEYIRVLQEASAAAPIPADLLKFEAVLNDNKI